MKNNRKHNMRTTQKSHKTHQAHCKIHLPVSLTPASAHQRALEHFWTTMPERMLEIASRGRIVLHHVDTTLKHKNPKRYAEWRPEDLVPLEKCEHISMHNSHPHSKAHNARISAGIRRAHEERAGTIIIGISPEGYPSFFENASAAAATIGVSR